MQVWKAQKVFSKFLWREWFTQTKFSFSIVETSRMLADIIIDESS